MKHFMHFLAAFIAFIIALRQMVVAGQRLLATI